MLVTVAESVTDDSHPAAIRVHLCSETSNPDMAIAARFTGNLLVVDEPFASSSLVRAPDEEFYSVLVREAGAAIAVIEIPLAVRPGDRRVQAVIVVLPIEPGEEVFAFVDARVEDAVSVDIGIDDEVGWLSDHHLVIKDAHAEGSDQFGVLNKHVGTIGLSVPVPVLQHDDAVSFRSSIPVLAIIHTLSYPDPARRIGIHVGGVQKHGAGGPDRQLQVVRHRDMLGCDQLWVGAVGIEWKGAAGETCRLPVKDEESHGSRSELGAPDGPPVVEGHLGPEGRGVSGDLE